MYIARYRKKCECRNSLIGNGNDLRRFSHVVHSIPSAKLCSLQRLYRKLPVYNLTPSHTCTLTLPFILGFAYGLGGTAYPLGPPFLLFSLSGRLVHPQSLLSSRPSITDNNTKQNAFPPCPGSCISGAGFVRLGSTGSIPEVHRECDSLLSSSRHSLSFSI